MLTTAEARAIITTSLSDADLGDAITREEAWLARRIGPLEGQRVETFIPYSGTEVLLLQRPCLSVMATDDDGERDPEIRGWSDLVLTEGAWRGTVDVVYVPTDDDEVRRALITLLRLSLAETPYVSQAAGGYSYSSVVGDQRTTRWAAWRTLLRPRMVGVTVLQSPIAVPTGVKAETEALYPVSVVAAGS